MRKAIYKNGKFPNVILELPHEMDIISLPEHIAFENKGDVKRPFIFYYSHTELYKSPKFIEVNSI